MTSRENTNFSANIPRELQRADELLAQYGRWATSYGAKKSGLTIERQYIREADRKESLEAWKRRRDHVPPEQLMPPLEAMDVQRALAAVDDRERIVLRVLYIPRWPPVHVQMRALRIPPSLSQIRHLSGLQMFKHLHAIQSLKHKLPVAKNAAQSRPNTCFPMGGHPVPGRI